MKYWQYRKGKTHKTGKILESDCGIIWIITKCGMVRSDLGLIDKPGPIANHCKKCFNPSYKPKPGQSQ